MKRLFTRALSALALLVCLSASAPAALAQREPAGGAQSQNRPVTDADPRVASVVNVRAAPYLASGDGTTDDTAAVRAALAAALAAGRPLYFPKGTYRLAGAAGSEFLLVTKSIEIYGDGARLSRLLVASGTPATKDVIRVAPPATGNQPDTWLTHAAVDNEGYYFHDFGVVAQVEPSVRATPYPRQPARHAIHFDITAPGQFLMNSRFERLYLGAFSGRGMYFNNSNGAGSFRNQDGFAQITIRSCDIRNGIRGEWWGDHITIEDNDLVGQGVGIESTQVPGASNLTIFNNRNTTRGGAALFHNGRHINYTQNEDELYILSSTGAGGATVNFAGDLAQIEHVNFQNNHVNAYIPGIAAPLDGVHLDNVKLFAEDFNRMSGMSGKYAFRTTARTLSPVFGNATTVESNSTSFALTNGAAGGAGRSTNGTAKTVSVAPNPADASTFQPGYIGVDNIYSRTAYLTPITYAALTGAIPSPAPGRIACVSDSNTATWGAPVAGGGTHRVLVWFNGTHWAVYGK